MQGTHFQREAEKKETNTITAMCLHHCLIIRDDDKGIKHRSRASGCLVAVSSMRTTKSRERARWEVGTQLCAEQGSPVVLGTAFLQIFLNFKAGNALHYTGSMTWLIKKGSASTSHFMLMLCTEGCVRPA